MSGLLRCLDGGPSTRLRHGFFDGCANSRSAKPDTGWLSMDTWTHAAFRKSDGADHVRSTARRVLLSCCIALIARASGAENANPSPQDLAVMQATVIQFA